MLRKQHDHEDGEPIGEGDPLIHKPPPTVAQPNQNAVAHRFVVITYVIALLLFTTGWTVLFKRMNDTMPGYPYFLNQLTVSAYIPVCFALYWIRLRNVPNREAFEAQNAAFPKRKFFYMGALDAASGLLAFFSSSYVAGPVQNILNQGIIPFTMLFARILPIEKEKAPPSYSIGHYIGALNIFVGIFLAMYPTLSEHSHGPWYMAIVFACNNIPYAISAVYKERALKTSAGAPAVDLNYLYAWINVFNFTAGILLAPVIVIFQGISFHKLPQHFADGATCWAAGENVNEGDHYCQDAFWLVISFILLNITTTIFMLLVMKYRNAALGFIAMAVSVPLADILFTSEAVMGTAATILTYFDIVGLIITVMGLLIYGWVDYKVAVRQKQQMIMAYQQNERRNSKEQL
eukprot:GFYU01012000.1.p1 GENE.GFYU01012000.1~~GFYU01012000.1.p1  ORF type:complete len:404 (-),score=92.59 GFYU01012000.1:70-1281(-)